MKKSILLGILGIAVVGTTAYGQGYVNFLNYFSSTSPTINFAASVTPPSKNGLAVGSSFTAELLWFNGLTANPAQLSLVAGTQTVFGTSVTSVSPVADGDLGSGAGFFIGPTASLTGYTSGLATFQVDVFGTEGGFSYAGQSALFTMTPATGSSPVPGFNQLQVAVGSIQYDAGSYNVVVVPEPTTLALGGLGLASLLLARRKKA